MVNAEKWGVKIKLKENSYPPGLLNKCVAMPCGTATRLSNYWRTFCNAPDLDLQCWWKTKKI